ncbi:MAG: NUDIX hydrolase N-terminal domain-containing protein [Saccharofermentans sp.]|nr:NUDIX hydrolase N-terminal domain-containing protein [Saccharofermentans sp.]
MDDSNSSAASRIVEISHELQAIAACGKQYAKNQFDIEHFDSVNKLAAELLTLAVNDMPLESAVKLFEDNEGYQTPKIDTRAVIFNERDEVLLVRDYDGKWALPGGWCDYDQSIVSNTVKEAYEEAGLRVKPLRLAAAHSHKMRNNPNSFFSVMRFFMLCEVESGEFTANSETSESAYYPVDALPSDLNSHKATPEQIKRCLLCWKDPSMMPEID